MFCAYSGDDDFIGMDICVKFLYMGFTRARRYANHSNGRKYSKTGEVLPQSKDALTNEKAKAAGVFKLTWDKARNDPKYIRMRKEWRDNE